MSKSIIVDFENDGTVKIEAQGFKGIGCAKATAFLEKALGKVKAQKKKPEWNQQHNQGAAQSQKA